MKTQPLMALLIVGVGLMLVTSVSGCTRQGGGGGQGPGETPPPTPTPEPTPPSGGGDGVDVGDLDDLGLGDQEGELDGEPNTEGIDDNLDLDL